VRYTSRASFSSSRIKIKPSASILVKPVDEVVESSTSNASASIDLLPSSLTIVRSDGSLIGSSTVSTLSMVAVGIAGSTISGTSAIGAEAVPQAAIARMEKERV